MKPADREQLRLSLLRHLEPTAGRRWGLSVGLLLQHVRAEGLADTTLTHVTAECGYLLEKGLVAEPAKQISPEQRAFTITAAGRDWLAEH